MFTKIGYFTGTVNGHLTGRSAYGLRSSYRPMLKDVLRRIEQRLTELGLSASAASRSAGLSEDAIRNMRRAVEKDDRQGVSTSTIFALAPVLQTTASWLLEGTSPEPRYAPILGYVAANPEGQVLFSTGDSPQEFAPIPPGGSEKSAALWVRGHSMRGVADDGALIYFENQHTPPTPDMLRFVCVVETDDGEVLIKRLLKGSEPGLYDLESIAGPLREDVRLRWAALITAFVPPYQARQIVHHAGERAA
jgi:SOS-response transcriptional repressor LexA